MDAVCFLTFSSSFLSGYLWPQEVINLKWHQSKKLLLSTGLEEERACRFEIRHF